MATSSLRQSLGLRSLRQRLSLLPVAVVFAVSLIAAFYLHQTARNELYDSREQLARGLADNLTQHLVDQLSEVRDELASWARFLVSPAARSLPGASEQDRFQTWLRGLGDLSASRYDIIALVDHNRRITAINDLALSVPLARPLGAQSLVGSDIAGLIGEQDDQWIRRTLDHRLPSSLSWRAIAKVNELYARKTITSPDDVVRSHQLVMAVPVLDPGGANTRALVAIASWAPFQRIVDEAERHLAGIGLKSGYGFVFDSGGDRVIAHKARDPQARYADSRMPQGSFLGLSPTRDFKLPEVTKAAVDATGRAFEYEFPPGNRKFAVFNRVDASTGGESFAFDWRLGIGVDYSDIFAPLERLREAVILATLAVILSVALVGVWLGRSVSLSVKEFTHMVNEASAGRFDLIGNTASHDEISELSQAMNQLFVSMRQRSDLQPIPNPYVVGNPVRSSSMFYGRQEDLRWIDERLSQPGNEMILLYGQRRIGKTSLLHQIRNQRERGSILPVFVDTHGLLPMLDGDEAFYAGVARTISRELSITFATGDGQAADRLLSMIQTLNLRFPACTLVLLFDEVDAMDMKMRDGTLSSEVTSFLMSILESDSRLSIVSTGSSDGTRLGGPFWSVIAPKSIGRRIGLLSRPEGMRLIREPVGDQIEFEDGVPERLLRLTGGHPYYAQTFCQRLVDALNERRTRLASADVVTQVTDQLLAEPPLPLDDMWRGSTSLQCWIMAELARLLSEPDAAANADALLVASDHAPTAVVAELRRLTISEILEESAGRYRFPVDFIRQWIRKEQLWWGVAHQRRQSG
ncbi:MAG TPA: ATP-binding protein [Gemmatimonadales bacterium]|nr:ATP-binding protein [Gemmatimonadales bacterium]